MHIALDGGQDDRAFEPALSFLHKGFEMPDRRLHGLGALQDLGHNEFVVVKQAADLVHARHEWSVDNVQGCPFLEGRVEVVNQPVFRAFYDVQRQPFIQRQVGARVLMHRLFFLSKVGGKSGNRVQRGNLPSFICLEGVLPLVTAPVNQIIGEAFFFFGNRGIPFQLFRVHNRQVETRFDTVIEKHGVQHLAAGRWEAEGHIADTQDGLAGGERLFNQPDPFDCLLAGANIVAVTGSQGKHQRVENNIFCVQAVFVGEQCIAPFGYGKFSLPGDRHALFRVFINTAHHHRGSVAFDERHDLGKPLLAVFQVDGVDDRLAL